MRKQGYNWKVIFVISGIIVQIDASINLYSLYIYAIISSHWIDAYLLLGRNFDRINSQ